MKYFSTHLHRGKQKRKIGKTEAKIRFLFHSRFKVQDARVLKNANVPLKAFLFDFKFNESNKTFKGIQKLKSLWLISTGKCKKLKVQELWKLLVRNWEQWKSFCYKNLRIYYVAPAVVPLMTEQQAKLANWTVFFKDSNKGQSPN